jgi:hypothetical protein
MAHAYNTYMIARHPKAAGPRPANVVIDQAGRGAMAIRPCRVRDRVLARVLAASLDSRLAAGESPESGPLLAARARVLVSPRKRAELARDWEHLLDVASEPPRVPHRVSPLRRQAIIGAAPAIRELAIALRAPHPAGARGVAAAITLITSGGGPLYSGQAPVSLEAALLGAIAWLDPAVPLLAEAGSSPA